MSRNVLPRLARALLLVAFAALSTSALAQTPSLFASMPTPIGIHATQSRVLVTQYCIGSPGEPTFFDVDAAGNLTPFAPTFPSTPGCLEKYLDFSPGLGGFPRDYVYAIQGSDIWEISPDGASLRLFATLPEFAFDHNGVTFDRVGTFGHQLIATTLNGSVYTVAANGVVTFLASVGFSGTGVTHENPEVVPVGFGPYGGQVWTAAEAFGMVFAISPAGEVNVVASGLPGAETVNVVPTAPCTFRDSGGAFFVTSHAEGAFLKYPASDFAGLGGDVLVTGEVNLIWRIGYDAASNTYPVSVFDPTVRHHEGATFARCPVVKPVAVDIRPGGCPNPVTASDRGQLPVAVLGSADLLPQDIDVATVRLAGVAPLRSNLEDVSAPVAAGSPACACTTAGPDGFRDLTLRFGAAAVFAALGPVAVGDVVTVPLTGKLLDGTPIEGQDCVVVVGR